MRPLLPLFLLTVGCLTDDAPPDETPSDDTDPAATETDAPPDDTDTTVDTDDTDDSPTDTDGGDVWYHAILTLQALGAGQGFDVDGDGDIDNAIGAAAGALNPLLTANYGITHQYAITQLWGVDTDDDLADIGLLGGRDVDEDPSDNGSGTESFHVIGALSADGHAPLWASTSVDPLTGEYTAVFPAGPLVFGTLQIPLATPGQIRGVITATTHHGAVGGAVLVADLMVVLDSFGVGWVGALLGPLADIDVDGDGTNDALSVAFGFNGVACELETP